MAGLTIRQLGPVPPNGQRPSSGAPAFQPQQFTNPESKPLLPIPRVQVSFGQWSGEGATLEEALNPIRTASHNHVLAHENSHLAGLKDMAASGAVLIQNEHGITVAGHVKVKSFGVNPNNPWLSMEQATKVMVGANAPGADMSDADSAVSASASAVYMAAAARAKELEGMGIYKPDMAVKAQGLNLLD